MVSLCCIVVLKGRVTGAARPYGAANVLVFVSSAVMNAISASPDFQRTFVVNQGTVNGGVVVTRIAMMDGFQFIEVEDPARMYTALDFTDGFQPVTGVSQPINLVAVARDRQLSVVRHNAVYMHAPGTVGQGDGWLYQYRLYHGIFMRPNAAGAVVASVGTAIA